MTSGRSSKSGTRSLPGPRSAGPSAEHTAGFVAVGRIISVRGVSGEVLVEPLTDFPDRFRPGSRLWLEGRPVDVEASAPRRGRLGVKLAGVDSRERAEALRGRLLEVPESGLWELEPGTYYRFQLLGMTVVDRDGRPLGVLADILETGANDVYVVNGEAGELLVPAVDDVVLEVDVASRRMVVDLPGQL